MKNIKVGDVIAVVCFILALSYLDWNKETAKALLTGGVITWWAMKRLK